MGRHEGIEIQEGFVQRPSLWMVNSIVGCIVARKLKELIIPLYSALVILHLGSGGQVWVPLHKKEIDKLE